MRNAIFSQFQKDDFLYNSSNPQKLQNVFYSIFIRL